jgi:hypothetical protein
MFDDQDSHRAGLSLSPPSPTMSGTLASSSSTLYTTVIPTAHATAAVVLETPPPPPLFALLPYLAPGVSPIIAFVQGAFKAIFQAIYQPIPVVLFLLSPLTTFLHYLAAVLFFIPYTYGVYVATEVVHPLYVFCGVACLTGVLLGLLGRTLSSVLVASVLPSRTNDQAKQVAEPRGVSRDGAQGDRVSRKGKAREMLESEEEDLDDDEEAEDDEEEDWSEVSVKSDRRKCPSLSSASSPRLLKKES